MRIFALLTIVLGLVLSPIDSVDAKRLGGGSSFGKRQTTQQSQPQVPAGTTAGTAARSSRTGMMGGMLGGLLAGSLLGALFFGGAFDGIGLVDILIFAGIAFLIVKFIRGRAMQGMQRHATAGGPSISMPTTAGVAVDATSGMAGSIPFNLPKEFDTERFLDTARSHFYELQQAWNAYDMDKVKEFCSPALYAQLAAQRAENAGAEHTVVDSLDAQIVRADSNAHLAEISVLFTGIARDTAENSQDEFNEVWHLERDLGKPDAPWLIVGIQQRDDA